MSTPTDRTPAAPAAPAAPARRGRQAEAARNDAAILEAARTVFLRDPAAPMSAVAHEAGVGVGGLYRRYAGKDELLQTLCGDGLRRFVALAEETVARLDDGGDAWAAFEGFVRGVVESDVHALTVRLAGTFRSTPELRALAVRSGPLVAGLVARAREAGVLRPDVTDADLPMVFEQLTAVRVEDVERTAQLRRRYLALHLDALRARHGSATLPGGPPTASELRERWDRSH
ncbi:helix-turn-helix domain-containing protein [Intrasporangium sp. YIM S08009]|uniref:TetR/AcrR family transcriptional regulator n=1 Tax=Intrasporangium zincisolvens TaxID=3080018 RepID=UPI002B054E4F|nr:helix-turn-helix domain-containing protein [Intrasporangium sp. YIM S08009]